MGRQRRAVAHSQSFQTVTATINPSVIRRPPTHTHTQLVSQPLWVLEHPLTHSLNVVWVLEHPLSQSLCHVGAESTIESRFVGD